MPFEYDRGAQSYCAACLAKPPKHDCIRAAVKYDDLSAKVALRLKYSGKIGLARVIAQQLVRHLPENRDNIIITPVPLHWTRMWSRSFNQSALIGRALSAQSGIAFAPDILVRHKRTPSMRGLNANGCRKAVGQAFAVHPKWRGRLKGSRIDPDRRCAYHGGNERRLHIGLETKRCVVDSAFLLGTCPARRKRRAKLTALDA